MIKRISSFMKRVFMPQSLRVQLLTRTLFILSFILLIIGLLQYWVMKDFLYKNEADMLNTKLMSLQPPIWLDSDLLSSDQQHKHKVEEHRTPNQTKFLFSQDLSLALIDPNGNFEDILENTAMSSPQLTKENYQKMIAEFTNNQQIKYRILRNNDGTEQLIVFRPIVANPTDPNNQLVRAPNYILQMGSNTAPLRDVLFQQLLTFIVLSGLALMAGLALYLLILKKTLVPLSNIVNVVKHTNVDNLTEHLPVDQGQEEMDRLSETYNEMLERLETSFEYERETKEQMRRFIADASHELRTPLTSIHGFLEVLLRGAANRPEQLYNALNSMHGESKRIIKLVENLLFLTKMDREPALHLSDTNLTELVREMKPQLSVLAGERNVVFDLTEGIEGSYDADKIKQVILNLFQNAVQHTDPVAGKIKISLIDVDNQVELSVQDNGPGIEAENLSYIFDRFYRIDQSRTRQYGGAGLGLSITKTIVHAHSGTITVNSQIGEGATFLVYFPLHGYIESKGI